MFAFAMYTARKKRKEKKTTEERRITYTHSTVHLESTARAHPPSCEFHFRQPTVSRTLRLKCTHRAIRSNGPKSPTSRWKGKQCTDQKLARDTPNRIDPSCKPTEALVGTTSSGRQTNLGETVGAGYRNDFVTIKHTQFQQKRGGNNGNIDVESSTLRPWELCAHAGVLSLAIDTLLIRSLR